MSAETRLPQSDFSLEEILDEIQLRQLEAEQSSVEIPREPQTRKEVKDGLSRQERDDRKRAGKLVVKVLEGDPLLDQTIPVDGLFSRGRTSSAAVELAQENLRAHGIVTVSELEQPAANAGYEVERDGDKLQPYPVLRVSGIDDRANLSSPKHAR